MQAAVRRSDALPSVEARLRLRTMLLGQPLLGTGQYAQLNSSAGVLLRMELAIQAGETTTSVTQVSDGKDLWEHWRLADKEHFHHVDLAHVARTLRGEESTAMSIGSTSSLASGGIPKLMTNLRESFDFSKTELAQSELGGIPVWVASGVWRLNKLAKVAPDSIEGNQVLMDRLPAHIPHQVEITLGQQDLFPYRIAYRQWRGSAGEPVALQPMVTIEFFDVALGRQVDPTQFDFKKPENLVEVDRTEQYLRSLGVGVARRPARGATR